MFVQGFEIVPCHAPAGNRSNKVICLMIKNRKDRLLVCSSCLFSYMVTSGNIFQQLFCLCISRLNARGLKMILDLFQCH